MRTFRPAWLAALTAALVLSAPAGAQTLTGRIVDAADGSGVTVAQVLAVDSAGTVAAWTLSRREGRFELRLPDGGSYRLHVQRVGYDDTITPEVAVGARQSRELDVSLRAKAVQLEGIEAKVLVTPPFRDRRALGFYDRMVRGRGTFYTAEEIAGMNRRRLTDVITYKAGISVRRGRLWVGGDRRGCTPTVYLDGFRRSSDFLDDALSPGDVWGIEIYRYGSEIPTTLQRDDITSNCGVVMIWTPHS